PRADKLSTQCRAYLDALREIESVVRTQPCEAEMVADAAGVIWLLQARPLASPRCDESAVNALRCRIESKLETLSPRPPLLGMMPDWNPAELLGEHPRPLARELFDGLITRRAWRIGRAALGYARIEDIGLLQFHGGRPYVDVRTSFRSLLPAGLDAEMGERMVGAYCKRLRTYPEYHDKIEFEVAFTTLTCGIPSEFAVRYPGLLDDTELAAFDAALRGPASATLDSALTDRLLEGFMRDLQLSPPAAEPARLRHWLQRLELRTGVRFAVAARQAFAVDALLRSAVESGALDATLWRDFKQAAARHAVVAATAAGIDHGHVRAGTFDIAAPARQEFAAHVFAHTAEQDAGASGVQTIDGAAAQILRDALCELGLGIAPDALLAQYRRVVHAREFGKFVLARGVSLALDALATLALTRGIDRDEAGWLSLADLLDPVVDRRSLHERVKHAREMHAIEARLRMPLLIDDVRLDTIHHIPGQANWLGRGRVDDVLTMVDAHTHPDSVPLHAIIAIASANPGFDWIFPRRPAALLTAFGGPNSHMAIRCAEAGVPALLGVGPEAFRRATGTGRVRIDFEGRTWTTA
ncbi:MAG: PEP-utilizing enzyme, partial [Dokdonella sp.]